LKKENPEDFDDNVKAHFCLAKEGESPELSVFLSLDGTMEDFENPEAAIYLESLFPDRGGYEIDAEWMLKTKNKNLCQKFKDQMWRFFPLEGEIMLCQLMPEENALPQIWIIDVMP
jgi:hypothetical protein